MLTIPSLQELYKRILNDFYTAMKIPAEKQGKRSFFSALSITLAYVFFTLYKSVEFLISNLFLTTATNETLILEHAKFEGLARRAGSKATGRISLTFSSAARVNARTELFFEDKIYETTREVATNVAGEKAVAVESKEIGSRYNSAVPLTLTLRSPLANVNSKAPVKPSGAGYLSGGSDLESVNELRQRVREKRSAIITGGNLDDYITWAKEIPGVYQVFVKENYLGPGKVGVFFIINSTENFIPNANNIKEVKTLLLQRRPLGSIVEVYAPVSAPLYLTLKGSFDTATKAAIQVAVKRYLLTKAALGSTYYRSQLSAAISAAEGEISHQIVSLKLYSASMAALTGDVTVAGNAVLTFGAVTFIA